MTYRDGTRVPKRRLGAYPSIRIACIKAGERLNAAGTRKGKLSLGNG